MRANLKSLSSLDINCKLSEYKPDDPYCFGFTITLAIGCDDTDGADLFNIYVCTPDWIKSQYDFNDCIWGKHMLIMIYYDYFVLEKEIKRVVNFTTGKDWNELVLKLSKIAHWEFDEYIA